jgi:hypothetical protein
MVSLAPWTERIITDSEGRTSILPVYMFQASREMGQ